MLTAEVKFATHRLDYLFRNHQPDFVLVGRFQHLIRRLLKKLKEVQLMLGQETFALIGNDEDQLLQHVVEVGIHKNPSLVRVQNGVVDHVHQNLLKPIWITDQFLR